MLIIQFKKIIDSAKRIGESPIPESSTEKIESLISFLNNQIIQLNRFLQKDDKLSFHLRLNHMVFSCIQYYFLVNKMPIPAMKQISLKIKDPEFISLPENVFNEADLKKKYDLLQQLVKHTIILLSELK